MAAGTFRELGDRVGEWFLRKSVLSAASAQLPRRDEPEGRAFEQVQLLGEIARQVSEPRGELPAGQRPAVLLTLYRDLVYWTLAAERKERGETSTAPDLATAWRRTADDRLLRAAGSAENLAAIQRLLIDLSPTASLDATEAEVARVRAFTDRLYRNLEGPRRRVERILIQRWLRVAAAVGAVLTIVFVLRAIAIGPDLAKVRPFRTSSKLAECATGKGCDDVMFHTREENEPWVEFDLGGAKRIHRIEVRNRWECCQDRAIPLVAEVSNDRSHWKEVARQDTEFTTWTARLPPTPAKYVRLRVPRATYLHLVDVTIR